MKYVFDWKEVSNLLIEHLHRKNQIKPLGKIKTFWLVKPVEPPDVVDIDIEISQEEVEQKTLKLEEYLALNYPVIVYPENNGFTAKIAELPGCISQAEDLPELWHMIEDARRLWLTTAFNHGDYIPLPRSPT